jgi:hypothetical protein
MTLHAPVHAPASGHIRIDFRHNPPVRTGVYVGVALSVVFTTWIFIANWVPLSARFAMERNVSALALLLCIASIPVLRFYRTPDAMLLSSLIGWSLLTVTYELLCWRFVLLKEHYSTGQVFVIGALLYVILATLSWVGTMVWRVRRAHHLSHPHH